MYAYFLNNGNLTSLQGLRNNVTRFDNYVAYTEYIDVIISEAMVWSYYIGSNQTYTSNSV